MRRNYRRWAFLLIGTLGLLGCSDLIATEPPRGYDASTPDPDAFDNEQGALELYKGAVTKFRHAVSGRGTGNYIVMSGLLADELSAGLTGGALSAMSTVDSRLMSSGDPSSMSGGYGGTWRELHAIRMQAMTSIEALSTFGKSHPRDLTGHLYAMWGMAEVMLANFFCSGIPLTTVRYDGSFRYAPASTREQVYQHAIAMFDSAMANTPDSVDFRRLAELGKGWALLNLNRVDEAAAFVAGIPTDWVFVNLHAAINNQSGVPNFTSRLSSTGTHQVGDMGTVADREGGTGLPFRTGGDPRTLTTMVRPAQAASGQAATYKPNRWMVDEGGTPIIVASGVEARLIQAEASLRAGSGEWLNILNALRTDGTFTETPDAADPAVMDTVWTPGAGAVLFTSVGGDLPGLAPVEDPGTDAARVDLLFAERANWLFLTGRRHSDLRRLIRQYGRQEFEIFPQGGYPAGPVGTYGVDVNAPAPGSEILYNPEFEGCFDRQA